MKIIECPRDAMQGFSKWIPTEKKINYLNTLLNVGFDTLDCGSFVSAKAIPQLADTAEVLQNLTTSSTKLLTIVANTRGAEAACTHKNIDYLGFPFSLSPTFQMRNTNKTMEESYVELKQIKRLCDEHNKDLVVYFSMGFGNPYNDMYSHDIIKKWTDTMLELHINTLSMADTVGAASPNDISDVYANVCTHYKEVAWRLHIHTTPTQATTKLEAAYKAGFRVFEGALKGLGGCPFADDKLVGNLATEQLIEFLSQKNEPLNLNTTALNTALNMVNETFLIH
jgi:hydroxymethylglutaryl-CoA lyase